MEAAASELEATLRIQEQELARLEHLADCAARRAEAAERTLQSGAQRALRRTPGVGLGSCGAA